MAAAVFAAYLLQALLHLLSNLDQERAWESAFVPTQAFNLWSDQEWQTWRNAGS